MQGMILCLAGLLGLLAVSPAWAVLADNLTIGSARAISLGNAVTADPPGIDSAHFNPAGLTRLHGRQAHLKGVAATFSIDLKFGDYNESRKNYLNMLQGLREEDSRISDGYFYDEAHNSASHTEGASLMLPVFGLTDIPVLVAPLGGASYQRPGSDMTFATNVYAPMMVGFYRADNDPGRWIGHQLGISLITLFSPSVGFKLTDEISLGATLTFNYAGLGVNLPFRSPHAGIGFLGYIQDEVCDGGNIVYDELTFVCGSQLQLYGELGTLKFEVEDPLTLGFNAGFLWSPTSWLTVGGVYQSPVKMDMKGDFSWTNSDAWNGFSAGLRSAPGYDALASALKGFTGWSLPAGVEKHKGKAQLDMTMPEHIALGVSVQVTSSIKLNVDTRFTAWSGWQGIPVKFSEQVDFLGIAEMIQPDVVEPGGKGLTFPLGLKDTWNVGVGIEYKWNDKLVLRAGVEDRPSSIPKKHNSPLLPIGSGQLYGAGFGWQPDRETSMDFALGYFSTTVHMPGGTSRLGNSTDSRLVIYNPYAGTDVTAEMTAIMLMASYVRNF